MSEQGAERKGRVARGDLRIQASAESIQLWYHDDAVLDMSLGKRAPPEGALQPSCGQSASAGRPRYFVSGGGFGLTAVTSARPGLASGRLSDFARKTYVLL